MLFQEVFRAERAIQQQQLYLLNAQAQPIAFGASFLQSQVIAIATAIARCCSNT